MSFTPQFQATDVTRYCFLCEWFDATATLVRKYNLYFWPSDGTLELYDLKNRRTFLKRCAIPGMKLDDLYVGAHVTVYARPLKVIGYGDDFTASKLGDLKSRTAAVISATMFKDMGKIVETVQQAGFVIGRMRMCKLSTQQAAQLFGDSPTSERAGLYSKGPIVALEIIGSGVQQKLKTFAGSQAESKTNSLLGVYVSQSPQTAEAELNYLFENSNIGTTAQLSNCTCCLIKPHAVAAGQTGKIIDALFGAGFEISALQLFILDRQAAEEFFEVYRGVVPEYHLMVEQLCSGPCLALEVRSNDKCVEKLRELCGPADPEIGRYIRPNTLRATFGKTKVQNAVHCTDLPEDGKLECEFFFSILQKSKPLHLDILTPAKIEAPLSKTGSATGGVLPSLPMDRSISLSIGSTATGTGQQSNNNPKVAAQIPIAGRTAAIKPKNNGNILTWS